MLAPRRPLVDPRLSSSICAGVSFLPDFGGGITSSASLLEIRANSSLSPLLPGTITGSLVRRRASFESSRRSALRVFDVGAVAGEAVFREDRQHVAAEVDGGVGAEGGRRGEERGDDGQRNRKLAGFCENAGRGLRRQEAGRFLFKGLRG